MTASCSAPTRHAAGTFDVKITPQAGNSESVGRMSIDKQFQGDLLGIRQGEMLAVMTGVQGPAGYVARAGDRNPEGAQRLFSLQHSGTMNRGDASLAVTVVPDSGTDQLAGLAGTMTAAPQVLSDDVTMFAP